MDLNTAIEELRGAFEKKPEAARTHVEETSVRRTGILDIPIELQIVLGSIDMLVSDIFELKENSIITLDRGVSEPVDIVANGRRVARGELTVLDGTVPRLGIRLTSVVDG